MDEFEEAFKELIPMFYGDEKPQGLESPQAHEKRHLLEMEQVIERYSSYFSEGFKWFIENGPCKEKLMQLNQPDGLNSIVDYINEGHFCLGTPLNLSVEDYAELYNLANKSYEVGNYLLARSLYAALIFLNYTFDEFWIGLALTNVQLNNNAEAEMLYKLAIFLNPFQPAPYFYYGHFLDSLKDPRADLFLQQGKVVEEVKAAKEGEIV